MASIDQDYPVGALIESKGRYAGVIVGHDKNTDGTDVIMAGDEVNGGSWAVVPYLPHEVTVTARPNYERKSHTA